MSVPAAELMVRTFLFDEEPNIWAGVKQDLKTHFLHMLSFSLLNAYDI
ncbi:MAG: hypothetical protein ABJQ14_08690 [Hyphomicrobiales bacterium]